MAQKKKLPAAAAASLGSTAKAIVLMKPTAMVTVPMIVQSKSPICVKASKKRDIQIVWSSDKVKEETAIHDIFSGLVLM